MGPSSEVKRPGCKSGEGYFCKIYHWHHRKSIILRNRQLKESLRVKPDNNNYANAAGHMYGLAKWTVSKHGNKYKFKSQKTGKYLRFSSRSSIDVKGSGGRLTTFYRISKGNHWYQLKNVKYNRYLCVKNNNRDVLEISRNGHGHRCQWKAWK